MIVFPGGIALFVEWVVSCVGGDYQDCQVEKEHYYLLIDIYIQADLMSGFFSWLFQWYNIPTNTKEESEGWRDIAKNSITTVSSVSSHCASVVTQ